MRAPLSVVIPTLDAAARIGPCLAALAAALPSGLVREVVIADGGSTDDIAMLADGTGARLIAAPKGRGPQLVAGADAATGPWLLFLHADTVLPTGWDRVVRHHIAEHAGQAGYFGLRFEAGEAMARVTGNWANLRSVLFALPYGDQGLLISRKLYDAVGGHQPIPLMEDVAIVRTLGRRRLRRLDGAVITAPDRYRRDGWVRRGARNIGTLALYFAGVAPERLAERYHRR
ncbi:MAG: TIGR04283 family arsenosugar biosynthesis glycosyltransferase [Pseudomonadota bacterium]